MELLLEFEQDALNKLASLPETGDAVVILLFGSDLSEALLAFYHFERALHTVSVVVLLW